MKRLRFWCIGAIILALTAGDCLAAIAHVQDTSETAENTNSVSATFSSTPTEGSFLVAIAGARVGSAAPTTPSGWSVVMSQPTSSPGQVIYYKVAGASESATVTVGPYPNSTSRGLHIYEFTGFDPSDPIGDTATNTGNGVSIASGSVTTLDESMMLTGVTTTANGDFWSWTNSFVELNDFRNAGNPTNKSTYAGARRLSNDGGTFSTTSTCDSTGSWISQLVGFNAMVDCECTVTTVADAGAGSLRECLAVTGVCSRTTITFNIAEPPNQSKGDDSWWRISPASSLPGILSRLTSLDGSTQTINQGDSNSLGPEIEISGTGLYVYASSNLIKDLVINGSVSRGMLLRYGDYNEVYGCYLGTSATGDSAIANGEGMTFMNGSRSNHIGGSGAGEGNLISGNSTYGIYLYSDCDNNEFLGNRIGTNVAGTAAIANGDDGFYATECRGLTIGGPGAGERNIVSGNGGYGLYFEDSDSITIQGNRIGTDSSGATAMGNTSGGIYLSLCDTITIGGTAAGAENIVSGNGGPGIYMAASDNVNIYGNMIGTGPTGGETGLGNGGDYSVWLGNVVTTKNVKIGGLGAGEGNVIAEGTKDGVVITVPGPDVEVAGNIIRDHDSSGVVLDADSLKILGNLIYGNGLDGINFVGDDTTLFIYHNTIHGNGSDGIEIGSDSTYIKNNIITGNGGYGIRIDSGVVVESYNLVTDESTNPANTSGRSTGLLDASDKNADPQYADTTTSDFSLTECSSPAVNAGVNLVGDQPDMNGSNPGLFNGPYPDMGAFESLCDLSLSVAIGNPDFTFGIIPTNQWLTPESSLVINDGSGAENFLGRLSSFTDGSNTWDISDSGNGADTVRIQWSTTSDTGPWTNVSAYDSDFTFATNVVAGDTVAIWIRLQTPVTTSSTDEYSSQFTVTAEAF